MKYEKKITANMKHSPKPFFKYLNSKRKIKSGISELKNNEGKISDNSYDNANLLGTFFASIFIHETESDINSDTNNIAYVHEEIGDLIINIDEAKILLSEIINQHM